MEEGQKFAAGINVIQIWAAKMVRNVIALTPHGVMALMTTVFSPYHLEQFASYLVLSARSLYRDFRDVYRMPSC